MLNNFIENKLFTEFQSDFLPGNSCILQLLSTAHEVYKFLDCNSSVDVIGTFLYTSRAFDQVWYDLIYKLKLYGVENKLLNPIQNYLTSYEQCVFLKGQTSKWTNILAGAP